MKCVHRNWNALPSFPCAPSILCPPFTLATTNAALTRYVIRTISTTWWEQYEVVPFIWNQWWSTLFCLIQLPWNTFLIEIAPTTHRIHKTMQAVCVQMAGTILIWFKIFKCKNLSKKGVYILQISVRQWCIFFIINCISSLNKCIHQIVEFGAFYNCINLKIEYGTLIYSWAFLVSIANI